MQSTCCAEVAEPCLALLSSALRTVGNYINFDQPIYELSRGLVGVFGRVQRCSFVCCTWCAPAPGVAMRMLKSAPCRRPSPPHLHIEYAYGTRYLSLSRSLSLSHFFRASPQIRPDSALWLRTRSDSGALRPTKGPQVGLTRAFGFGLKPSQAPSGKQRAPNWA